MKIFIVRNIDLEIFHVVSTREKAEAYIQKYRPEIRDCFWIDEYVVDAED